MARLYSDEDFPLKAVLHLRGLGHDVLTIQESGLANRGTPDPREILQSSLTKSVDQFSRLSDTPCMPIPDNAAKPPATADGRFEVTRWSIVLAAGGDDPASQRALGTLCMTYWYPLYAFVRRQGHQPHDAQDLTQEFFAKLLQKGWLDGIAREKGKFRSFLLASMTHFLSNERDRARAQKRGGGRPAISLDTHSAESRYAMEPVEIATPEKIFERRWAMTLLEQVLTRLRAELAARGNAALFEELKATLTGQPSPYGQIAERLGMSQGAVKVAAHRLRQRYRELIREEVAQTVGSEGDVEEELRDLMSALSV